MGKYIIHNGEIYHHGVKGMKWGVRRTKEQLGYKNKSKASNKSLSINEKFSMKKTNIKLGDTPAVSYEWTDTDGSPVARFHVFDWWDGKNIEDLLVYDKYKGNGYSYQLLDYATKKLGVKNLAVRKDNVIAKHVYDKYGFKTTEEDDDYYYMSI